MLRLIVIVNIRRDSISLGFAIQRHSIDFALVRLLAEVLRVDNDTALVMNEDIAFVGPFDRRAIVASSGQLFSKLRP